MMLTYEMLGYTADRCERQSLGLVVWSDLPDETFKTVLGRLWTVDEALEAK